MAFDFEQYLHTCKLDNSYKNQPGMMSFYKHYDEIPSVQKALMISKETVKQPLKQKKTSPVNSVFPEWKDPLTPGGRATEMIEFRFQSCQDVVVKSGGGGKPGLFKQTSLPASFDRYSKSKGKTESGRRRRNSVRFADEMGENLTTFVMIPSRYDDGEHEKEGVDTDSKSAKIAQQDSIFSDKNIIKHHGIPEIARTGFPAAEAQKIRDKTETPSFQPCFDQPAANFEKFRRRLFLQFICLENVKVDVKSQTDGTVNGVVNHGTVLCTIKVRNIHPVKRVFARCTDNSWRTYADIAATYVCDGTSGHKEYDTFAFALQNPFSCQGTTPSNPNINCYRRKTAAVEFALCYEVLGSAYWDNNDGHNYQIVWM